MKINSTPSGLGSSGIFMVSSYPTSGIYRHPTDSSAVLVVNKVTGVVYYMTGYEEVLKPFLDDNKTVMLSPEPPTQHITASDLLRAIAISQKPDLATTLLHPTMQ